MRSIVMAVAHQPRKMAATQWAIQQLKWKMSFEVINDDNPNEEKSDLGDLDEPFMDIQDVREHVEGSFMTLVKKSS